MSTSTLTPPVPIVLIGIHTEIGAPVAEALRPDWDVTRFIQTFEAAESDLPYLLRGENPPNAPTNTVGSANVSPSNPPRAILFGRGFTQQQAESLFAKLKNEAAAESVLWAAGAEANRPPGIAGSQPPPGVEKIMVPVFRGVLEAWKGRVEKGDVREKGELVLF
ncbi:hypothetical protein F5Y03DRAFT_399317 [Xylaria venustula]|nr:hypothetical protein F5Y03DRAFT_399317 [Xylaria venustula]